MSDYRGRLIDIAARALLDGNTGGSGIDIEQIREDAEAVIDALGFVKMHGSGGLFRVACLEAPAVQTHDYGSDHETRHGL